MASGGAGRGLAAAGSGPGRLTDEELAEFREIFNLVDKDGGGTISKDELLELMETLGINASPEEVELMINEVDEDQSGEIDFEEFVAVMSRKVNSSYTPDQVKAAFKIFEGTAPSGYIKVGDLLTALTTYCSETVTEAQAAELISQLEPDTNGLVNYAEYVTMMMSE
uniref:Calmodulin n=1 Tax=Bicosoecida sp. CB-2014 TaxID=1486930 RepID=A0A7S1GDX7_9STRA|mmetsp:Transcript_4843/g.17567  ORF Transcript_4843/g.17567 Transcript_4843/m.17567 type:complete len:167 (+) Transcript_4843:344-844(+)